MYFNHQYDFGVLNSNTNTISIMKMQSFIMKAAVICGVILWAGCSEVNVCIQPDGSSGGSQPDNGTQTLVTFHASVEGRNMLTRAMTPISKDVNVQMFAYRKAGVPSPVLSATGEYVSLLPGMLSGVADYKMYLINGVYDLYSFSENAPYSPVSFDNAKSAPLDNNVDYLWWGGLNQDVNSEQINIPIVLNHCATQVSFEVSNGSGVNKSQLAGGTITPSKPGAQLDLFEGVIPVATEYDTTISKMGVNANVAQCIMLPLQTTTPMTATFDIYVNEDITPRTYTVSVPIPDGILAAGNSYRFKLIINGNEISFDEVNVRSWVDVDETGKPLYPKE